MKSCADTQGQTVVGLGKVKTGKFTRTNVRPYKLTRFDFPLTQPSVPGLGGWYEIYKTLTLPSKVLRTVELLR